MPRKPLKYVQEYRDNRGKLRYYFRRKGYPRVPLLAPWEDGFLAAYNAAATNKEPAGKSRLPTAGTVGAVIVHYLGSSEFRKLSPETQGPYRRELEALRRGAGDDRIADYRTDHLEAMLDRRERDGGHEAANNRRKMLRKVFSLAVKLRLRSDDPTAGIKKRRPPSGSRRNGETGHRTWTEDDIATFINKYPLGTRQYLALCLLLHTGQRRGDGVRLGPKNVVGGSYDPTDFTGRSLSLTQSKTGTPLTLPIVPELAEALALANIPQSAPAFLLTRDGEPFSPAGFTNQFRDWVREAGIQRQASPHGLRKALATRLADAGRSGKEIAAVTGHRSLSEVQRYTEAADQKRLAEQAMKAISRPAGSRRP